MQGGDPLAQALARARVDVRALDDLTDLDDARAVFDAAWPGEGTNLQRNLLRAMVHAGAYVSVAYREGEALGAAFGFVGRSAHDGVWQVHLHSHMAAVLPAHRDEHIGTALKWHQRAWALERGIDTVVWTFDPLVRRNAVVNLVKLGVDVEEFAPDFYGQMEDAINADDASDRLFATWRLASVRVERAIGGDLARIDVEAARVDGRDLIAIPIPDDIVALRSTDRREAAMWRQRMRTALTTALADGYVLVGITTDDGYALERR